MASSAGSAASALIDPELENIINGDCFLKTFPTDYVNPRNIPRTDFLEDVVNFLKSSTQDIDDVLSGMQSRYQEYRFLLMKLSRSKVSLQQKIPQITQALDVIHYLQEKVSKEIESEEDKIDLHFQLSDNVAVNARVKNPTTVGLWLGADVMVDFPFDEGEKLLRGNLESANKSLETTLEDLAFVRDQMIICEVNIARVWNYEVKNRQKKKEASS